MTDTEYIYPLDTELLRQRSVRGAAITSVSQALKFGLMLASQIILARLLNPEDFGIIAMIAPVSGFVAVMADLGIAQAIVQHAKLTHEQLNAVFWVNVLLSVAMASLLMILSPALALLYHEQRLIPVTIAVAALVVVTGLSVQQTALLNRTMRFSALALSEILSLAFGLAASAFAASRGWGYWSLVLGLAATAGTINVVVWTASSWRPSRPAFSRNALSMLRFGGNVTVSNIALYLNSVLDNGLVGWYLGAIALGLYDRAWKLAVLPLSQLMAPVNRVAIPTLARLTDHPERYRNAFRQMLQVLLLASLPALTVGITAAQPLITLLFGAKWHDVSPIFSWLCVGSLLTPINTAMFWIFLSQGRSRDQKIYGTTAAIINVFSYVVGLHWGLIGVARTSAIISYMLPTPILMWAATRSGPIDKGILFRLIFPYILSTLASIVAIELYRSVLRTNGFLDLAVMTLLAYAVSLLVLACFSSGRSVIKTLFAAAKGLVK